MHLSVLSTCLEHERIWSSSNTCAIGLVRGPTSITHSVDECIVVLSFDVLPN